MTDAGPWLAVLLAVAGSAAFAVAAVTQQRAAARLAPGRAFDPAVLVRLARRPAWLAGMAAVIVGFALQAAALGLGMRVVIEPVLASGLLFALALAAWRDRRPLSRTEWAAALAVVAGLAVFLAAGEPARRPAHRERGGAGLAVARGRPDRAVRGPGRPVPVPRRALLFGARWRGRRGDRCAHQVGGGAGGGHVLALFADARLYLLIVAGLLAFTIQQNGYRAAGLAAFLPAFAVVEPVSGSRPAWSSITSGSMPAPARSWWSWPHAPLRPGA